MGFEKYQHVERWNSLECDGLLDGICHVFPKIDGTNASIWYDSVKGIGCGSRNRELELDNDNAGFMNWAVKQEKFEKLFTAHWDNRTIRLFGEWLVPHSLKTYRDDAWRDFYVFDVMDENGYLPYEEYKPLLVGHDINYIPPLAIIKNPSGDDLLQLMERCGEFLIKDGEGKGEGIVVKNYDFVNKYGRTTWGKMITNEFKYKHHEAMGAPLVNNTLLVEEIICRDYLSNAFIEKERAKIINAKGDWTNKMIPELLGRVWYEFLREEIADIVQKLKNPKINFQILQRMVQQRTKEVIGIA